MRSRFATTALGAATLLAVMLGGCSASQPEPTLAANPETVDFTAAAQAGTPVAVHMPVGATLAVEGSDTEMMEAKYWTATIADGSVVKFVPADFSGRVATLPLLISLGSGETTAVVTYSGGASPETVTYEVTVSAD